MCRNIKTLYNFNPPATNAKIQAAATQYVRKISGFATPSTANVIAFNRAVEEVTQASATLLGALVTNATPRNREMEAAKLVDVRFSDLGSHLKRRDEWPL